MMSEGARPSALSDLRQHLGLERASAAQRRRGELEARTITAHADEANAALLHDEIGLARFAASGEPGIA